ncbi:alpha-glucan family phosphorylase [Syntrophus sp. (in: bacteria)]|uniref:alpha-glucan family phosphorylase n=1 Tax=Syntrophus sp. (in: bacteria) TaxID=48412 RepID=UPI00345F129D
MDEHQNRYLFECSWEICNKVGGIYTVISSKIREALKVFGENYYLLGPDLKTNLDFEETDEECWNRIREGAAIKDLPCRFGRWRIPGEPKVILVNFGLKYNKDQLLYRMWEDYGVDSIAGGWDYTEPVMFSHACGEVIETIYNLVVRPQGGTAIAQFHEWMTGAGLLFLKKAIPEIGTVFTTHATILGRTLAGSGMDIYASMDHISPLREANTHNITAKYSMEVATAREAGCLTTVSEITALEAKNFLGRYPDIITPNGLDMEQIPNLVQDRRPALRSRMRLLKAASRFLKKDLPGDTKIMAISGRYEFHNKGIDIFLEALGRLEKEMEGEQSLLVFFFILGGHTDLIPALQSDYAKVETGTPPICTHRLHYEASDPILETSNRLGLKNLPQNRINMIFIPAYLNGHDGLINLTYYEALAGCDLGVFPSYYEPWGYTPQESAAHAVPTISTDQAGFGLWVQSSFTEHGGVMILKRKGREPHAITDDLSNILKEFLSWTEIEMQQRRESAWTIASRANWVEFFKYYTAAYDKAEAVAREHTEKLALVDYRTAFRHSFAGTVSTQPHFRRFTAVANLPREISRLRELAYNLWWAWNPSALDLFAALDPQLWTEMGNNPVRMLETVSAERLIEARNNTVYMGLYESVMKQFDRYMTDKTLCPRLSKSPEIKWSAPVAYFSTEYGLHESLPIYSGGLGVLSGDHIKTASDLNIPLVGVGLLYRSGYFKQFIDKDGVQIAEYPESDFSNMPLQIVQDEKGEEVQISLELPGRTLYANIWEVQVGRLSLYLLNSDVPGNTPQDRNITGRLYPADQRTRIEQELLLGAGGIRLLRKLGIKPSLYHLNEGHSAFLVFSLIQLLMTEEGLNFDEASEVVRSNTVFTTHTPVEAGNERFNKDLIEHYFSSFVKWAGISWSQFYDMGLKEAGDDKPFFMTVLGLKMSHMCNGVSQIHGRVARRMWRDVWKGFHELDIPIRTVTNGVHMASYIAPKVWELFDLYFGRGWQNSITNPETWKKVWDIPDAMLWRTRYELKQRMIDYIRNHISRHWSRYGYSKTWREELYSKINPTALMIGFARRFAPYKRADLILSDLERLDKILNHPTRPVHLVFAGKAHPNDEMGKSLIKKVIAICNREAFRGKIIFLDDYDINVARHLVRGVDVWLNTPRRPHEASGTSGEKVIYNGVLNLSISDGWWAEGYDGENGWTIGPVVRDHLEDDAGADEEDALSLYSMLENSVIPLFYDRDTAGIPDKWIAMIKRSIHTLAPRFNTERMLQEYYDEMYLPTVQRSAELSESGHRLAREIAQWKSTIPMRFSSLHLLDISVEGIQGDTIVVDQPLVVTARIDPGKLSPEEIYVELFIGRDDGYGFLGTPDRVPLKRVSNLLNGSLIFTTEYRIRRNGPHSYGIRVLPYNDRLASRHETGLILWG